MKESKVFLIKFLLYGLLLPIVSLILSVFWGGTVFYLGLTLYLIIATVTIIKSWTQVPHKWVYVVEKFGKFSDILEPGYHFVFPWFGFLKVKLAIFTGEIKLPLFDEEIEETDDYQGGIVDFNDESAKIKAFFYFEVRTYNDLSDEEKKDYKDDLIKRGELDQKSSYEDVESKIQIELYKRAAYQTSEPILYIKVAAETALRSFLAQYELEEANELKTNFELYEVSNMFGPKKLREIKKNQENNEGKAKEDDKDKWKDSRFGKKLIKWGFTPTSFMITDIQFPDRMKDLRASKKKAKYDVSIAEFEKEVKIKHSEGDAEALKKLSLARKIEVKDLVDGGMNIQEAIMFVTDRRKYEALTKSERVFFFEGDSKNSKKGAEMGAGFGASTDK